MQKIFSLCRKQNFYKIPLHDNPFFCVQTMPDGGFNYWTMYKQSEWYPELLFTEDFSFNWDDDFDQRNVRFLDYGEGAESEFL